MLDLYRREYVEFISASMREYYLYLSGQKEALALAPIYERHSDLLSMDSINKLKQALDETSEHFETERASVRRLLIFAVEQFLDNSVKHLTEAISQYESKATIDWMGRQLTFQEAAVALSAQSVRDSRRLIYQSRVRVIESSNDLREERITKLHENARELGYGTYTELFEELRRQSFQDLARDAKELLTRTEAVYISRLDEALKRDLRIGVRDAERFDASYFQQLKRYEERFPAGNLLQTYRDTMAGLGISVDSQKNIYIDDVHRPHKSPRAFCVSVSVPDEIRLVIRPNGGQSDYQSLLHEGGHAQHYGWTAATLSPEFKYTGDYTLTETYAFLFNHLITDKVWLRTIIGFPDSEVFVRSNMLTRLVTIRRYAAKVIYERELHLGEDFPGAAESYSESQTAATRFKTGAAEFLFDLDDSFYSANYLRAWAFEVALREYLMNRFGKQWWSSRRAGNFLKELWETGDRYTADEMASQIGIGPIAFDPLVDELNDALKL